MLAREANGKRRGKAEGTPLPILRAALPLVIREFKQGQRQRSP